MKATITIECATIEDFLYALNQIADEALAIKNESELPLSLPFPALPIEFYSNTGLAKYDVVIEKSE